LSLGRSAEEEAFAEVDWREECELARFVAEHYDELRALLRGVSGVNRIDLEARERGHREFAVSHGASRHRAACGREGRD
jgi:hypothetical protein